MEYVRLDNFEGPLDLLLHLVKESNVDIFDIQIEEITDKYLDYIRHEESLNINVSSSYLVMASELMYLKSKMLLPNKKETVEEEDEELTRESLINKLYEYKKYKEMTGEFKKLHEDREKIYIKGPESTSLYTDNHIIGEASVDILVEAFKNFLDRKEEEKPHPTIVTEKEYSVRRRKSEIIEKLKEKKKVYLDELIETRSKPYIVVTFLGVLEMVKEKEVIIKQDHNFNKILVELRR